MIKSASDLLRLFSGIYGSEHFVQACFCLCVVLLINKCFGKIMYLQQKYGMDFAKIHYVIVLVERKTNNYTN